MIVISKKSLQFMFCSYIFANVRTFVSSAQNIKLRSDEAAILFGITI